MALTVRTGQAADLGWNKRIYVSSEGTLIDLTNSISDAQINQEVETETYSVYGSPNDKNVSTSVSYPLVINTMYATEQANIFNQWLEQSKTFFWAELVDVSDANSQFAQAGSFTLGSYGVEGVTIGAAPTDGLIEMGLTPTPLGDSFEGKAYPFQASAAGNLSLGSVDDLEATDRIWVVLTEVNGTTVTLTATVGGTGGAALDVDETKADIYELAKHAANASGALTVALAGSGISAGDPVNGYILVGKSVVEAS